MKWWAFKCLLPKEQSEEKEGLVKGGDAPGQNPSRTILEAIEEATSLFSLTKNEAQLGLAETKAALKLYKELQRVLSVPTSTDDFTGLYSKKESMSPYLESIEASSTKTGYDHKKFVQEFEQADAKVRRALANPAAVQPLGREALHNNLRDFFILDNSLRETTVGTPKGHTLQEKHKIVDAIAESGLQEIILGAFGTKIGVDSQIAERWSNMGKSFDNTWGFANVYDFEAFDTAPLQAHQMKFLERVKTGKELPYFNMPQTDAKTKYSREDYELFKRAHDGFQKGAFGGKSPSTILKESESPDGRIPMGLLLIAGYGICNVILEAHDVSSDSFDHQKYDFFERYKFLIEWSKKHLPRRQNVEEGEDNKPRVLVGFTDFANFQSTNVGLERALTLIHELCIQPPTVRPFGFTIEDPAGWDLPDETGKSIRMMRLAMDRAGFPGAKLLVHFHMYFGMAEASVLSALCNGADGVWAAMCKVGSQVGHASSTVTAVNLVRAGHDFIADRYNLKAMCHAAREIHSVSTREKCPEYEEVYGEHAFDVDFILTNVPSCRHALGALLDKLDFGGRSMRLNELSPICSIEEAMTNHFGTAKDAGWNPVHCQKMQQALHGHLLTGLSRDYNSALGLGHLYNLVQHKPLSLQMIRTMMEYSTISDYHPTVLEFVQRWNRLCAKVQGKDIPPVPGSLGSSCLVYDADITVEPLMLSLPFETWIADVYENHVFESLPESFKNESIGFLVEDETMCQGVPNPKTRFFDCVIRLKLFIEEADSLGVLPLVDDFCLRKDHDFFFGDDTFGLRNKGDAGTRPEAVHKLLMAHMDYFSTLYTAKGNTAHTRWLRAAAKRIVDDQEICGDIKALYQQQTTTFLAVNSVASNEMGLSDSGKRNKRLASIFIPASGDRLSGNSSRSSAGRRSFAGGHRSAGGRRSVFVEQISDALLDEEFSQSVACG